MATKVYIFNAWSLIPDDYDRIVADIKRINPDRIFAWLAEETDYFMILSPIIDRIWDWLGENKRLTIIGPMVLYHEKYSKRVDVDPGQGILYYFFSSLQFRNKEDTVNWTYPDTLMHGDVRSFNSNHLFSCYNNRRDLHRVMLLDTLARDGLLSNGVVTYKALPDDKTFYPWQYYPGGTLKDEDDYVCGNKYPPGTPGAKQLSTMLDVVTESRYRPGEIFFTEKTFKSIFLMRPFLVLGSQYYHAAMVKEYGLELYPEMFDYSFDNKPDLNDRVEGIVSNLKRLRSMSTEERTDILRCLLLKMMRNRNKLLEISLDPDRMIPMSMQFLRTDLDVEIYQTSRVESVLLNQYWDKLKWIKGKVFHG
jgi:hypothetical protein